MCLVDMLELPEKIRPLVSDYKMNLIELRTSGTLQFHNQDLFTFSLEEIPEAGWHLDASTRDLHHDSVLNEGNIMTEYEEKFSSKGNPICKLIASR